MATSFVPLHLRSNFSFLRAVPSPAELVSQAAQWGFAAAALTDENNLCAAVHFFEAAKTSGVHAILGATLESGPARLVLLVENEKGYENLCLLTSACNLEENVDLAARFAEHSQGLIALIDRSKLLERLAASVDRSRLYAHLVRPAESVSREIELLDLAARLNLPLVASTAPLFIRPQDAALPNVFAAMREGKSVGSLENPPTPRRMLSPGETERLFQDLPEALANTLAIAERCEFDLLSRRPVFPRIGSPEETARMLRDASFAGARRRYGPPSATVRQRLEHELDLIARMGFADYFLVVADIVDYARRIGSPSAGRGSGAGSIVAYSLSITNVDPLAYRLPFERFLNSGREDWPDLDVDFCWRLRDKVIDYVYEKYGNDHVAMVSTHITFQPRLAFRESARAFGLADEMITRAADALERGATPAVDRQLLERIRQTARRIEGFPHHLSVHCGGVVITPEPIATHAPLVRAAKGVVITQYEKDAVERTGLVKLDLLGNRSISTIAEAARWTELRTGERIEVDEVAEPDDATRDLLARADTLGVGQLESPAMRSLIRMVRPAGTADLMKILALIRPGAASQGMKELYVKRLGGLDRPAEAQKRFAALFDDTCGIMLYEDDALDVLKAFCGLDAPEADKLRRRIAKRKTPEQENTYRELFFSLAARCAVKNEEADYAWTQIAKFNAYSFCRAHSASYARLAYAAAYLKAHRPVEFWTAALNNNAGMYARWVYIEQLKHDGLKILGPCVNHSGTEFRLEGDAIRVGLGAVEELTQRTLEAILRARPFEDLDDLVARTRMGVTEAENLIRSGALDFTAIERPRLLYQLHAHYREFAKRREGSRGLLGLGRNAEGPALADHSELEKLADEWRLLGLSWRGHPLSYRREELKRLGVVTSDRLEGSSRGEITLAGLLAASRRVETRTGGEMLFLTMDDESGVYEVTVEGETAARVCKLLGSIGPYLVTGRVDRRHGALSLAARNITRYPRVG